MFSIIRINTFKYINFPIIHTIKRNFAAIDLYKNYDNGEKIVKPNSLDFIADLFDMSDSPDKLKTIIRNNRRLKEMDGSELTKTKHFLQQQNILVIDKLQFSRLVTQRYITLKNRYNLLKECGFEKIDGKILLNFVRIVSFRVDILKAYGYIPENVCVTKLLLDIVSLNESDINEELLADHNDIRSLRSKLLNEYLCRTIETTPTQLKRIFSVYKSFQHKPLQSIVEIIQICKNDILLTNERIRNNAYIFSGDSNNLKRLLYEMKTLGDIDMRELLNKRPKIAMITPEILKKILQIINDFGIPPEALPRCTEILTLNPNTIYERLLALKRIDEFDVLTTNPRVLRLVHYQNKARIRLEYLKLLKIKCVSLHCLSTTSEFFEKFVRDGLDRTKGYDIINMLSKRFNKTQLEIRKQLIRHPHWCHVPVLSIKSTVDSLMLRNYDVDSIYPNLHILLYPIDRINEKLQIVKSLPTKKKLTKKQRLCMCMYLIEQEYHFTGDGMWSDSIQNADPLLIQMPDMPSELAKEYRFGKTRKMDKEIAATIS